MREAFISYIQKSQLIQTNQRYLLACSGGMDSMALAHLLLSAKIPFEIAHVNFQLRGEESELDQTFVEKWARSNQILFHLKIADTLALVDSKGISIQMAAREIRYDFFEELRSQVQLDGIILAHHQDDQLETIFLNLLRGTGIEGVSGMSERKGWLIRPLLNFSRDEIRGFMMSENLPWREDSSNQKTDYKRNNLRHRGLPAIYALEPEAKKNLITSLSRLKDTGKAFLGLFESWKAKSIQEKDGLHYLAFTAIRPLPGGASLLYFWLRGYGFNPEQVQQIWESLENPRSGAAFTGNGYQLWFDRQEMILGPISEVFETVYVEKNDKLLNLPEGIFEIVRFSENTAIDLNAQNALLDEEQLEFPLTIRTWKVGDRFVPLGMKTEKKVSDFLIDLKIPIPKKQEVKVLVSGNNIAWLIGMRIADWAKVSLTTRQFIHFKKN